jgi:N-acetylglucosamine kinase-like BadF-type ATPase
VQLAIQGALDEAKADVTGCTSAFAGIAGITTADGRKSFEQLLVNCGLEKAMVGVDHDIRIALAGGLGGRPGIALIVGTGSSCYGRSTDGRTWQTGGWEALISDEGSAYFLGREAIAAAAKIADGRLPDSPLRSAVFQWLGIGHIAEILPRIHDQGLARSEIAAFAPHVISAAERGDPAALDILDRSVFLLAEMVAANHRRLPTGPAPDIVITGGLGTAKGLYRGKLETAIHAQLPSAVIHKPLLAPAIGAALLAMEQAGTPAGAELVERLRLFPP